MTMSVDIWPSLQQIPGRFERLFTAGENSSLFTSKDWWQLITEHGFAEQPAPLFVTVEDSTGPIMIWPLRHPGANEPKAWRTLANYYSPSYAPVISPEADEAICRQAFCAATKAILSAVPGYPVICLDPIATGPATGPNWAVQARLGLRDTGLSTIWSRLEESWSMDVDGVSPGAYYKALPGSLRNTIRRKIQQAEKLGQIEMELALDSSHAQELVPIFEQVYAASWKPTEPDPSFMTDLAALCADRDALKIGILSLNDEPIAAQFWIMDRDRTALLYKLAHDETQADLSPGTLLTWHMIEALLETGDPKQLNFGRGSEPYKSQWMPQRQSVYRLQAFRLSNARGLFSYIRTRASGLFS